MDKPRTGFAEKRRVKRIAMVAAAAVIISLVTFGISRIEPAAPPVKKETVWTDEVKRGPMLIEVRGPGTLVPVDIRFISAPVDGRVERIPALPGVRVEPDTVLMELSDPQVEQAALEAETQLRAALADYEDLRAQLDSQLLSQQSQVNTAQSQAEQAKLQAEADEVLAKDGLIPALDLKLSRLRAEQSVKQSRIESERYRKSQSSNQAQLAAQRARVDQARTVYELRRRQVESLKVRATIPGVLSDLPVQVGQRVTPGTVLAQVARPEKLKAELRIPETQAKDLQVGQRVRVDTRNGIVPGRVIRIAPTAREGAVIVDVALEGALPRGARPDLQVDGTIEIERMNDVLFISRPAYGEANSTIELFKLTEDGEEAERVPVQIGRSSANTFQILGGLKPGDKVILSDISAFENHDRIRLE